MWFGAVMKSLVTFLQVVQLVEAKRAWVIAVPRRLHNRHRLRRKVPHAHSLRRRHDMHLADCRLGAFENAAGP